MTKIGNGGGTAGLIWHVDATEKSCSNYYYIGISFIDSIVFLAGANETNIRIISSASLGFTYSLGIFYALTVEIVSTNTFT